MIPITTFAGRKVAVFGLARSGIVSAEALSAADSTLPEDPRPSGSLHRSAAAAAVHPLRSRALHRVAGGLGGPWSLLVRDR